MKIFRLVAGTAAWVGMGSWGRLAMAQDANPVAEFSPLQWVILLGGLALLPFVVVMVTSFAKVAVVLAILRSAIGAQGVPPAQVIIGLSLILTVFIMAPVGQGMLAEARAELAVLDQQQAEQPSGALSGWERVSAGARAAIEPLRRFLEGQAHPEDQELFVQLGQPATGEGPTLFSRGQLLVLIPAFMVSELKEAFQIGFLIFIPFIIIDMVVANILLSLGMYMLSPTTISLPFKLLLFVMVDGWYLLVRGLVTSYQGG
ncbi:MAG: EscR/YscR/HrcR family type III secretion system export apparatus protein [Bradymonadales bacterium]|nr:EscR/YscR/HrcR family type III secretion system export apparatus protein [Bradymonadales bacterium]